MRTRFHRSVAVAIVMVAMTLGVVACGSDDDNSSTPDAANTFGLSEFTIIPPSNALHSGTVSITADNLGTEVHELVLVRAADAKALPTNPDGSVDEDRIPARAKVGDIDNVAAKSSTTKTFELSAGTYVALCNIVETMSGGDSGMDHGATMPSEMHHVHFAEGMHVAFSVT